MRRRAFTVGAAAAAGTWAGMSHRLAAASGEVPPAAARSTPAAYFGMHFHRLFPRGAERMPTRWPAATVGSLRLWDSGTRWADIAPRPGRWDFDRLDGHVELAMAHGSEVVCTLGSTPVWASARPEEPGPYGPGCAAEPRAMGDWQEYVERVVARYRGQIACYEVWNEPLFANLPGDRGQPGFFTGTLAQMLEMTRIARSAIDRIDPAARLATPGFVNGVHRVDAFLAAGGERLVDVMTYHFYSSDAPQFASQVAEVRASMARRGLSRLPLWNTECGVENPTGRRGEPTAVRAGELLAADRVAQFLMLGAALGLQRFHYHAWDNDLTGMVDREGVANPRLASYEKAQRALLDVELGPVTRLPGGGFRIDAMRGAQRVVFAWSDRGEPVASILNRGLRIASAEGLGAAPAPDPRGSLGPGPVAFLLRDTRDAGG